MSFRDEFQLSRFGFQDTCRERFLTFHWRAPGFLYVLYRLGLAAYTLVIVIRGVLRYEQDVEKAAQSQVWLAYLTNWTYSLLTVYLCYHALITVAVYNSCQGRKLRFLAKMEFTEHKYLFRELYVSSSGYQQANIVDDDPMDIVVPRATNAPTDFGERSDHPDDDPMDIVVSPSDSIPWYLCLLWVLFNTASLFCLVVTLVFWVVLSPLLSSQSLVSAENLQLHLVNSLIILLELGLTAVPVRLYHVVYPFIYGVAYAIFSAVYWAEDHSHVMYPILDWGKKPGIAAGCIAVIGFVLVPILQLILYGIHRLKLAIFHRFCWN